MQGGAVAVGQSTARSLSEAISAGACRLQPPIAFRRCHQASEEPCTVGNEEVESFPFPPRLHPSPPWIQVRKGCLPSEPSPPSGQ
jgi:hypothetical protein